MTCYRVRIEIRHIKHPGTIGWYKDPGLSAQWLTLDESEAKVWHTRNEAERFVAEHMQDTFATVEESGVQ